jgi:hypothetical protein
MIGLQSCPGCMYSGGTHLESCPEAAHNKYREPPPPPLRVFIITYYNQIDQVSCLNLWEDGAYFTDEAKAEHVVDLLTETVAHDYSGKPITVYKVTELVPYG